MVKQKYISTLRFVQIISSILLSALFSCSQMTKRQVEMKRTDWLEEITIAHLSTHPLVCF